MEHCLIYHLSNFDQTPNKTITLYLVSAMNLKDDLFNELRPYTVLDYRRRINNAMRFVDENWEEALNVQQIAKAALYSPYHFHRIFTELVGDTPAGHIRKERIRKSAKLLTMGMPVAQVAIATGFWTASAFSRSFKQTMGVTPSAFLQYCKDKQVTLPALPSAQKRTRNIELTPRIAEEPGFTLYYLPSNVSNDGLRHENLAKAARQAFDDWGVILKKCQLQTAVVKRLGVIRGLSSLFPGYYCYDAGLVFNREVSLEGLNGIQRRQVSAGRWAVFLHQGPYSTLWQTWNWIYNYWQWEGAYSMRTGDAYEVYLNDQRTTPQDELLTEVYIPVE